MIFARLLLGIRGRLLSFPLDLAPPLLQLPPAPLGEILLGLMVTLWSVTVATSLLQLLCILLWLLGFAGGVSVSMLVL
jgi:hypothetical protein